MKRFGDETLTGGWCVQCFADDIVTVAGTRTFSLKIGDMCWVEVGDDDSEDGTNLGDGPNLQAGLVIELRRDNKEVRVRDRRSFSSAARALLFCPRSYFRCCIEHESQPHTRCSHLLKYTVVSNEPSKLVPHPAGIHI